MKVLAPSVRSSVASGAVEMIRKEEDEALR